MLLRGRLLFWGGSQHGLLLLCHDFQRGVLIQRSGGAHFPQALSLGKGGRSLFAVNGLHHQGLLRLGNVGQLHGGGHADLAFVYQRKDLRDKVVEANVALDL